MQQRVEDDSESSWMTPPLRIMIELVVRYPRSVLGLALCATIVSVVYSVHSLGFKTSRLDLLNPASEYNQRWIAYLQEFQHEDDVILVVHAADPQRRRVAIDALIERLRPEQHRYRDIMYRTDLTKLREKGLHYLDDTQLAQIEAWVQGSDDLLNRKWDRLQLVAQMGMWQQWLGARLQMGEALGGGGAAPSLQRLPPLDRSSMPSASPASPASPAAPPSSFSPITLPDLSPRITGELAGLETALAARTPATPLAAGTKGANPSGPPDLSQQFEKLGVRYLESADGTYGFVLVRLGPVKPGEFARGQSSIERLRSVQREMNGRFPDVEFGVTGLPVMELDEMLTSQYDTTMSTVVSLVAVAIIFVVGFGSLGFPLLSVLALLFATAWSFAGAALTVGHLNILSVSFNVILIGLGIDFGIHFLATYGQLRLEGHDPARASVQTVVRVGPAILSGGVTSSLAFGAAYFTDFVGVAELGVIAALGILMCIIAQLTVLPALMVLLDRRHDGRVIQPFAAEWLINPLLPRARTVACGMLVITAGLGYGIRYLWYDHNLLNMQAEGVESVDWERRLLREAENSAWYVVSLSAKPEEILARKAKFEQLSTVHHCEEIVSLIPEVPPTHSTRIQAIRDRLENLTAEIPQLPVVSREILRQSLQAFSDLSQRVDPHAAWLPGLRRINALLAGIPNQEYYERITEFQQARLQAEVQQLFVVRELANPAVPSWEDLPTEVRERFVGGQGTHVLKVYAKGSVWDMDALAAFVREVEQVDPAATGQPIQTYYASRQMRDSYVTAGWYALFCVFATLLIDFRSLSETILAMLPVLLGMTQVMGVLGWLDLPLNPANMIVLPLLLGMGVDDGVHLVHDFRTQRGIYRIRRATAAAVVLTSLTTMAGFGSLMLARHQGLRSLGLVLTLGMGICLATSMWFLPMIFRGLRRPSEPQSVAGGSSRLIN